MSIKTIEVMGAVGILISLITLFVVVSGKTSYVTAGTWGIVSIGYLLAISVAAVVQFIKNK